MAEPRRLERLSGQDLLMLWADDFGWSEDIGVLGVLDGTRLLDRDERWRRRGTARCAGSQAALTSRQGSDRLSVVACASRQFSFSDDFILQILGSDAGGGPRQSHG